MDERDQELTRSVQSIVAGRNGSVGRADMIRAAEAQGVNPAGASHAGLVSFIGCVLKGLFQAPLRPVVRECGENI